MIYFSGNTTGIGIVVFVGSTIFSMFLFSIISSLFELQEKMKAEIAIVSTILKKIFFDKFFVILELS